MSKSCIVLSAYYCGVWCGGLQRSGSPPVVEMLIGLCLQCILDINVLHININNIWRKFLVAASP